jgi:tetratricopeptide (TPR) repeat protein
MIFLRILHFAFTVSLIAPSVASAQTATAADPAAALVKQSQEELRAGRHDSALETARKALASFPKSVAANTQAGIALDLMGRHGEARKYFAKAIEAAPTPQAKAAARRSMAVSYAFEGNCAEAAKHEAPTYQGYLTAKDFFAASEVAYEVGDICLEAGDLKFALGWYSTSRAAAREQPKITPARSDLWRFLDAHARARLAARRGTDAMAQRYVAAAKAILDKGTTPDQQSLYAYLAGYVAFYGGNYKGALPRLQKANPNNPLVLALIAQTHEKLGNRALATEYYRKMLESNAHDPANAIARPLAQKKLTAGKR